jgi:hypothetical protein
VTIHDGLPDPKFLFSYNMVQAYWAHAGSGTYIYEFTRGAPSIACIIDI